MDKQLYLWNEIYWHHNGKLIKYSQFFTKYIEILKSSHDSQAVNGVYIYPNTQSKNEN